MTYALTLTSPRGRRYTGTVTRRGAVIEVVTPGFDDSVLIAVEQRVATLAPTCERHTMTVVHYGEEWTVTIERVVTPAADEA